MAETNEQSAKNTYAVVLTAPGQKYIEVIGDICRILGISLSSAKKLVDDAPCILANDLTKEVAEKLTIALTKEGAFARIAQGQSEGEKLLHSALEKERVRLTNQLQLAEQERDAARHECNAAQAELAAAKGGVLVGQVAVSSIIKLVSGKPDAVESKLNALLLEGWTIAYENSGKDWYLARLERVADAAPPITSKMVADQVDAADLAERFIERIGPPISIQVEPAKVPISSRPVVVHIMDVSDPVDALKTRWQQEIIEAGQPLIQAITRFTTQPPVPLNPVEDDSCLKM